MKKFLIILFLADVLLAVFYFSRPKQNWSVNFLDVGQGDSILINKGNIDILIDGGPDNKVLRSMAKVRTPTDNKIEVVISTHADSDHLWGLVQVIKKYDIGLVLLPNPKPDAALFKELIKLVKEKNIKAVLADRGEKIEIGDLALNVIAPDDALRNFGTNESSTVVYGRTLNFSFLLTGDIEAPSEQYLARTYSLPKADILKIAHHGSKTSSSPIFLKAVDPSIAVISVGKNSYGHPHKETLEKLKNIEVERTDQSGNITIKEENGKIKLNCERACSF